MFNNHQISEVSNIKFIGIIIDSKINWADHMPYIESNILKRLEIIYKAKYICKTLLSLFYAFFSILYLLH